MNTATHTHTHLKLPVPLHRQFKTLAAMRGRTMVDLIADQIRQAIEAGELSDQTPGFGVNIVLDLDRNPNVEAEFIVSTPGGNLPAMTVGDLEALSLNFAEVRPNGDPDIAFMTMTKGGPIELSCIGTGIKIMGHHKATGSVTTTVVTPRTARDLARQFAALTKRHSPK